MNEHRKENETKKKNLPINYRQTIVSSFASNTNNSSFKEKIIIMCECVGCDVLVSQCAEDHVFMAEPLLLSLILLPTSNWI